MTEVKERTVKTMAEDDGSSHKMNEHLLPIVILLWITDIQPGHAGNNESRAIFDQRQSGKYNIHVSIKDVAIIELDRNDFRETNSDPDYYYDDSDFTIKPLLAWYQSLSTTKTPSSTEATTDSTTHNLTSIIHTTSSTITSTPPAIPVPQTQPPKPSTTSKKPSSVVILGNGNSFGPTKPQNPHPVFETGGQIPVQVIMEPVLHPRFRTAAQHFSYKGVHGRTRSSGNSRIFNLRAASPKDPSERKVRSSILEKLLSMLTSFHDDDDDDVDE